MSRRVRAVEILKSLLIVLLFASMSLLFLLTWSTDSESLPEGVGDVVGAVVRFFGGRSEAAPVVEGSRADTYGEAVIPAAIAVVREGSVHGFYAPSDALEELYSRVQLTLADCLGSAEAGESVGASDFIRAAKSDGAVFISYSGAQPLGLLALSNGVEAAYSGGSPVERLLLVPLDEYITIYYSGAGEYRRAGTSVESARLTALLYGVEGSPSVYSDALGFADGTPLALYPEGELRLPTATAQTSYMSESAVTALLAAFGMNTETNYRYVSADGTQYAVEGGRTLAVSADGVVVYTDAEGEGLSLRADATDAAVIEFCRAIAAEGSEGLIGDAALSLRGLTRAGGRAEVSFGCTLAGMPVYCDGLDASAVFIVENGALTGATLMLRRYTLDGGSALMMPPASAAAIGAASPAYFDDGESAALVPSWSK